MAAMKRNEIMSLTKRKTRRRFRRSYVISSAHRLNIRMMLVEKINAYVLLYSRRSMLTNNIRRWAMHIHARRDDSWYSPILRRMKERRKSEIFACTMAISHWLSICAVEWELYFIIQPAPPMWPTFDGKLARLVDMNDECHREVKEQAEISTIAIKCLSITNGISF